MAVLGLLGLLVLSGRPRRDVVCEGAELVAVPRLAEDDDGGPRLGPAVPRLGLQGVDELVEHVLPLGASVAQRLGTLLDLEENLGVRPLGDGGLEELVVRLFPGVERRFVIGALVIANLRTPQVETLLVGARVLLCTPLFALCCRLQATIVGAFRRAELLCSVQGRLARRCVHRSRR